MYISSKSTLFAGLTLLLLSGCVSAKPALEGRLDLELGMSVKSNVSAHAVAPTPKQKANTYIPADPNRSALARKNYRENTIDDPVPVNQSGG